MKTAYEIVSEWLKENGYGGLHDEWGCACLADDLGTCGGINSFCVPGYRVNAPAEIADYWYICKNKTDKPWKRKEV